MKVDPNIAIELQHIAKRFGTLLANNDISLTVRRREIVALLGENGAGKTTLMNIVFGHYIADHGTVRSSAGSSHLALPAPQSMPALAWSISILV